MAKLTDYVATTFARPCEPRVGMLMTASCLLAAALAAYPARGATRDVGNVDISNTQYLSEQVLRRHFSQYCADGVVSLRAPVSWSDQETASGVWRSATWLPYLQLATSYGLRFKLDLETIAAPPAWFIAAHPDARLVDQNGLVTGTQAISYWYPGLHALIHAKSDQILSMLAKSPAWHSVDFVIASLGPADEPIYPPQWTVGNGAVAPGFWWYDVHAQADFPIRMAAKYGSVQAANAAWHTSYASWSAVGIPRPGTVTGTQWQDVLDWYRDAKRGFVAWQIADTQALLAKYAPTNTPTVEVVVPGTHIPPAEWAQAVQTGSSSDPLIVQMNDTEFLIDTAARAKAALHVTGLPENEELQYIRSYMRAHGDALTVTGENVGSADASPWAAELTSETLGNDLDGLDYLYGTTLFGADQLTPSAALGPVAQMQHTLASPATALRKSLTVQRNFTLIQNGCIDVAPASGATAAVRLCLSATGRMSLAQGATTLWAAASPTQTCPTGLAWTLSCRATLQADGNLVFYNGTSPYWNTATSASDSQHLATQMRVSAVKPYLSLLNAAGTAVWTSQAGKLF